MPERLRNTESRCCLRKKFARTAERKAITKARNPMFCGKRSQTAPRRPARKEIGEDTAFTGKDKRINRVRQRAGQCKHCVQHFFKTFRAGDPQRRAAAQTGICLQQPRKTEDVISVIVRQGDQVCFHQADMRFAGSSLGAFSTVKKNGTPVKTEQNCCQRTLGKRHGCRCTEQSYGYHFSIARKAGRLRRIISLETQ